VLLLLTDERGGVTSAQALITPATPSSSGGVPAWMSEVAIDTAGPTLPWSSTARIVR
jgi:hypothetical protein